MTEETELNRRASDKLQTDIDLSIAAENDPRQRALLIILQSINRSLIANTRATQDTQIEVEKHRQDFMVHLRNFESHAMNEEALLNKGRGAWFIVAIVLSIAQSLLLYGWNASRNEIEAMKAQAVAAQITHEKLMGRLSHLEKSK